MKIWVEATISLVIFGGKRPATRKERREISPTAETIFTTKQQYTLTDLGFRAFYEQDSLIHVNVEFQILNLLNVLQFFYLLSMRYIYSKTIKIDTKHLASWPTEILLTSKKMLYAKSICAIAFSPFLLSCCKKVSRPVLLLTFVCILLLMGK